jgi:hypothetical protein
MRLDGIIIEFANDDSLRALTIQQTATMAGGAKTTIGEWQNWQPRNWRKSTQTHFI